MAKRTPLADKLEQVRAAIAEAASKAKRDPAEISLLAVTKSAAPEQIREVLSLGVTDLAESRVQQLSQRASQLGEQLSRQTRAGEPTPAKVRWHMIGHLQRNKVKAILPLVSLVHSVDSLRLAEEIEAAATKMGKRQPVLLQVNASEEGQKFGVAVGAATHLAEQIDQMPALQLIGLMTMASAEATEAQQRQTFARTREIFEELKFNKFGGAGLKHLSMGMSNDFPAAIAEGATMVRIGTLLFGGKPEQNEDEE